MKKDLSDDVLEWVKTHPHRHSSRVSFLALKNDIRDCLLDGLPAKAVWEFLVEKDRLSISYPQFTRYVHAYILDVAPAPKITDAKPARPGTEQS